MNSSKTPQQGYMNQSGHLDVQGEEVTRNEVKAKSTGNKDISPDTTKEKIAIQVEQHGLEDKKTDLLLLLIFMTNVFLFEGLW